MRNIRDTEVNRGSKWLNSSNMLGGGKVKNNDT